MRTPPWLLQPGDVVEVEIDRLGTLRTPIVGPEERPMSPVPDHPVPVLISGGGPSGLAAAIELGRRGIEVLVVEPRTTLDPLRAAREDHQRAHDGAPAPLGPGRPAARGRAAAGRRTPRTSSSAPACSGTRSPASRGVRPDWTTRRELSPRPASRRRSRWSSRCSARPSPSCPRSPLLIGWRVTAVIDGPGRARAPCWRTRTATAHEVVADWLLGADGSAGSAGRRSAPATRARRARCPTCASPSGPRTWSTGRCAPSASTTGSSAPSAAA